MATGAISAAGILEAMHGSGVIGLTVYNMVNNQGAGSRAGNPFDGPVSNDVTVVDSSGNAIPVKAGEQIQGSPDGSFLQVKDKNLKPTGVRKDGGHNPKKHPDPRAQKPHAHRPGVKNRDGTPWLPIK